MCRRGNEKACKCVKEGAVSAKETVVSGRRTAEKSVEERGGISFFAGRIGKLLRIEVVVLKEYGNGNSGWKDV